MKHEEIPGAGIAHVRRMHFHSTLAIALAVTTAACGSHVVDASSGEHAQSRCARVYFIDWRSAAENGNSHDGGGGAKLSASACSAQTRLSLPDGTAIHFRVEEDTGTPNLATVEASLRGVEGHWRVALEDGIRTVIHGERRPDGSAVVIGVTPFGSEQEMRRALRTRLDQKQAEQERHGT